MNVNTILDCLICPVTHDNLTVINTSEKLGAIANDLTPILRSGTNIPPIGVTKTLLFNENNGSAYPVVDGYPILMAPELLIPRSKIESYPVIDIKDPRYAEAYEEMEVYNKKAEKTIESTEQSGDDTHNNYLGTLTTSVDLRNTSFPLPESLWVDAKHDSLSQLEAYAYLAPVAGMTFVQLGGSGSHAIKALLAGAKKSILLTPMLGEARLASSLAQAYDVSDKFCCVIAIGEELPFRDNNIDLVYSGGCFHHMRLDFVSRELHRILKKGGKFSGVDPWKTPLHTIGTTIIGKREKSVFCKPITPQRLAPMQAQFSEFTISHHGPILRYLFLALEKLGFELPIKTMFKIARSDDRLGKLIGMSRFGGSLMIAGRK